MSLKRIKANRLKDKDYYWKLIIKKGKEMELKEIKERVYSKLGLLDVLMYERMQNYDNITRDGVEHDLIYLERILDKEIGEYTRNGGKFLRNEINGQLKDYTDGNGY